MILFRYLFREVVQATFAVSLVLLLIVMSGRLAKYLSQASAGDLAADVVFLVVFYRIPDFLPLVLPLGLFIGVLLAYGRLYVESEMVVMNACGTSKIQMVIYTLLPATMVALLVAYMSLIGAPASLSKVQSILKDPENRQGLSILQQGKFQLSRDGKKVSYAEHLSSDRESVRGVWLVDHSDEGSLTIIKAKSGEIESVADSDAKYFKLSDGVAYKGSVGSNNYQVTEFETFAQLLQRNSEGEKRQLKTDAKPTATLLNSTHPEDIATLHWRLSLPAVVLVVAIIALALSRTDHRRGRFAKMLPAILVYLTYIILITAVRDLISGKGVSPGAFWVTHAVFLIGGLCFYYQEEISFAVSARKNPRTLEARRD